MALKNDILDYLILKNKTISGQEMADHFHVSRGAIWKAIQLLKEEHYVIEGKNHEGYTLQIPQNTLSEPFLRHYVNDPYHIEIFDEIASTSTYAKQLCEKTQQECIVCADVQSQGRGRTGKSFFCPRGNLYFSFTMKVTDQKKDLSLLTIRCGLATLHAIKKVTGRDCEIKWVNDIYYKNKKAGGILSEAIIDFESKDVQQIIIGIGINLYPVLFPDELKDTATSLDLTTCNKNLLIASIINEMNDNNQPSEEIIAEYKKYCILLNREISYQINGQLHQAIAIDINSQGNLVVLEDNKQIVLKSGEVSLGSKNYEKKQNN